ncbi:Serpentine Receptor, class E (Epsilon) [Caenorhabditis elegans]|uniref:Serpentine Receptor, class E (Epsilon) n=1 Tax=Caenorhabditis elegans TaxID=6239 RepID=Q9U2L6_CAEEL|nr:Serpentine Receptor, class E (Epsilon) [Caenorhabditis elegans]CAB60490.2 Serpentine Receptor, class E (Epsilon) [Caenorhabditis elegans]|eukprot:NP_502323.2 Serpentine Receptor, class E (epsilon) [Caenorhabditis elegans]
MVLLSIEFYENASYYFLIILNAISILYYIFNTTISIKAGCFKRNIHILHHAIYVCCPIISTLMILEKILEIMGKVEEYESSNQPYIFLQFVRTALISTPFHSLAITVLERLCATYYIKDYERNPRFFIGFSLIGGLYASSILTACIIKFTSYILHFAICDVIMNIVSYIFLIWNQKLNRKYYHDNRRVSNHTYSLGERYQISENIRVFKYYTRYVSILTFFIIVCILSVIFSFSATPNVQRLLKFIFNLSYTLLTIFGPFFFLQMSDSWQNELHEILSKVRLRKKSKIQDIAAKAKSLRNTFGKQMDFERKKHCDVYFEQLKTSWNQSRQPNKSRIF